MHAGKQHANMHGLCRLVNAEKRHTADANGITVVYNNVTDLVT